MQCPSFCLPVNETFAVCQCPDFHRTNLIDGSCLPFSDNFLYLATSNQIFKAFLDVGKEHDEIIPLKLPHANITSIVASNSQTQYMDRLYWTDYESKTINAANYDGSRQSNILSNVSSRSLSIDHDMKVLYFIDDRRGSQNNYLSIYILPIVVEI